MVKISYLTFFSLLASLALQSCKEHSKYACKDEFSDRMEGVYNVNLILAPKRFDTYDKDLFFSNFCEKKYVNGYISKETMDYIKNHYDLKKSNGSNSVNLYSVNVDVNLYDRNTESFFVVRYNHPNPAKIPDWIKYKNDNYL